MTSPHLFPSQDCHYSPCGPAPQHDVDPSWSIPDEAGCIRIWDLCSMPDHIRDHSLAVARVAAFLTQRAIEAGVRTCVASVQASALLHDLAKHYTILHGGDHSQLGGAWVMELTGNPALAQGVIHHFYWPWELDLDAYFLPLAVLYADKRVMHDRTVSIEERYRDLFDRYGGRGPEVVRRIDLSKRQALAIETLLENRLGIHLHACSFDRRRLV